MMTIMLMCAIGMNAQKPQSKVPDKEIVGTWIMESMQWEGEKKVMCGKESGYAQFKYYGADGEYACAAISLTNEGQCVIMPHEYGTYSLKDGWYMEMGRPAIKDAVILTDKSTYMGTWYNRHDIWKKVVLPDKVVKHIVNCCKMQETPPEIQKLIKQSMFK